ncbi:hypothetical protein P171DRAFT_489475 [Karstenula rhodostoma CBS 690.94]|uniref:MARVEL domain-containing protein n=1 Tax=Karstenula rhodostoma CBS 690.94 TaxID=1392251 RepID=A0A9P4P9B5_9PLEO|nr:hypothetical protein P171DRAFT_489475 [Karstenula rhodostoma CBS 690.94]
MGTIWDIALRTTQIIFAFITLGLSANLVATASQFKPIPFILVWATMVSVGTLIMSILGLVSNWYERLEGKLMLLFDGSMVAANLAAGVLIAIGLKGVQCSVAGMRNLKEKDVPSILVPKISCSDEACQQQLDEGNNYGIQLTNKAISRCSQSRADEAFMLLTGFVFLGTFVLGWLRLRKGY